MPSAARWLPVCLVLLSFCHSLVPLAAADTLPTPAEFLGHEVCADYKLARYEQVAEYFRRVAEASDRVHLRSLGETTEGLPLLMAEISAPETISNREQHLAAQRMLADPRRIKSQREERRLVNNAKAVVLINCNLHSSEIASSQMALELLHELATLDTPRVREILDRTIVLLIPSANPDGLNIVTDWYNTTIGTPWEGTGMPWLYQKYAGHDNNRDWFMLALRETQLITRMLYHEWYPTIVYDIHQMGNSNIRFFVPPFHDPKNTNVHPLLDQALMIIGGHMASELAREGKKGVAHGVLYDNWWAGGFRTTPYRHNMVGILTEAASPLVATPVFQRKSQLQGASRGLPTYTTTTNFPDPWPGGWWRLRDVADYEKICCYSLLTLAARYRAMFHENYVSMGREAIDRGAQEPPYAWIVPAEQRDPASARHLLHLLHATGIEVHRADKPFSADGVRYPAGTHILYCSQPYRAHLMDMMERQRYPDRRRYPGGPAEPPYDIAGWTLPLQMGVSAVEVGGAFQAEARQLKAIAASRTRLSGQKDAAHYALRPGSNDDFRLLNRLHRAGVEVGWVLATDEQQQVPRGSLVVEGAALREAAKQLLGGLDMELIGLDQADADQLKLRRMPPPRIGLYQPWTASMDEGWTRLVLENFEFAYDSLHNPAIRAGNLRDRYDCIVLPSISSSSILNGQAPDTTAPRYVGGLGSEGVAALQQFVRAGGVLVCIDDSCNLAIDQFKLPVKNLVRGKKTEDFYCPGSVLRAEMESHYLNAGMPQTASVYFTKSQAFSVDPSAKGESAPRVVARYAETLLLESGWIRGESVIAGQAAVLDVSYGDGRILLFGPRVQHRAQPHGTFRLLFNALTAGTIAHRVDLDR